MLSNDGEKGVEDDDEDPTFRDIKKGVDIANDPSTDTTEAATTQATNIKNQTTA